MPTALADCSVSPRSSSPIGRRPGTISDVSRRRRREANTIVHPWRTLFLKGYRSLNRASTPSRNQALPHRGGRLLDVCRWPAKLETHRHRRPVTTLAWCGIRGKPGRRAGADTLDYLDRHWRKYRGADRCRTGTTCMGGFIALTHTLAVALAVAPRIRPEDGDRLSTRGPPARRAWQTPRLARAQAARTPGLDAIRAALLDAMPTAGAQTKPKPAAQRDT